MSERESTGGHTVAIAHDLFFYVHEVLLSSPWNAFRLGDEERRLMHLVPAPAVRLMKRRVLSRPGVNSPWPHSLAWSWNTRHESTVWMPGLFVSGTEGEWEIEEESRSWPLSRASKRMKERSMTTKESCRMAHHSLAVGSWTLTLSVPPPLPHGSRVLWTLSQRCVGEVNERDIRSRRVPGQE
jgi:hypothetical protein